jgi:hypothetical protein
MACSALLVEGVFTLLHVVPKQRNAEVAQIAFAWNYTTFLNLVFLGVAAVLLQRFMKTGGPKMLKHMNETTSRRSGHAATG